MESQRLITVIGGFFLSLTGRVRREDKLKRIKGKCDRKAHHPNTIECLLSPMD